MSLNDEQKPPEPGTARPTWELVIEDMRERDRFGEAKYKVRHQADNGRDHLVDAYQEALDLALYLRAEIEKRRLAKLGRCEFSEWRYTLPVRVLNVLDTMHVGSFDDFAPLSEHDFLKQRNFGRRSLKVLRGALLEAGIKLPIYRPAVRP